MPWGPQVSVPCPAGRWSPPRCKKPSVPRDHERNQRGGAAGQSRLQLGSDAPSPVPRPAAGGAAAPDSRAREGPRGRTGCGPPQGARPDHRRRGLRAPRTSAARGGGGGVLHPLTEKPLSSLRASGMGCALLSLITRRAPGPRALHRARGSFPPSVIPPPGFTPFSTQPSARGHHFNHLLLTGHPFRPLFPPSLSPTRGPGSPHQKTAQSGRSAGVCPPSPSFPLSEQNQTPPNSQPLSLNATKSPGPASTLRSCLRGEQRGWSLQAFCFPALCY